MKHKAKTKSTGKWGTHGKKKDSKIETIKKRQAEERFERCSNKKK